MPPLNQYKTTFCGHTKNNFIALPSLCPAVVVKQLPHWLISELLQEFSQLVQGELLHPVVLGVPRGPRAALDWPVVVVHAAVGVPQVVWDVDALHVVFDNPVVQRGNGTNQHKRFRALGPEEVRELRLVDPPGILVQLGVLRNHVGQGERGVAAGD